MKEPLNLPRGSIRAIIALAITGGVIIMSYRGVENSETFSNAWLMILGFYFGARDGTR